jgi:hypothetical protein
VGRESCAVVQEVQMTLGTRNRPRLTVAGTSSCVTAATNSPRKILKSYPWARHLNLVPLIGFDLAAIG